LNNVREKYEVPFISGAEEQGLVVHKENGPKQVFKPSKKFSRGYTTQRQHTMLGPYWFIQ